jgi:adenosylhomocysteine nucleosidase
MGDAAREASWVVVAALRQELTDLKRLRGKNLELLETGIGGRNAKKTLTQFLEKQSVEGVLGVGMAGGLSSCLRVGDLLVAERVVGATSVAPLPHLSLLARRVQLDGVAIHVGTAVTVNQFVCDASEKRCLAEDLGPHVIGSVDMESCAIAQVCAERRLPWLIIRCISDTFEENLPLDFNRCRGSNGHLHMLKLATATLRHPSSLNALWRLRRRSTLCAQRLAWFVDQFLEIARLRELTSTMRPSSSSS